MKVALPSGRVVEIAPPPSLAAAPTRREPRPKHEPLFAEARALFGAQLDVDALPLVDFHTLRAIAAHEGWLHEDEVTISCVNCEEAISVVPSRAMPLGPFLERALDDEELDARLLTLEPHEIPPVELPSGEVATDIVLRDLTVAEAKPLHVALAREPFEIDARFVRAMGIVSLGKITDAQAIGEALARASDEAWDAVTALFVDLFYPLRLFGVVRCNACGARNDVDAPLEREFVLEPLPGRDDTRTRESFVSFDAFAEHAHAVFERTVHGAHESNVVLVVEGGVAACDEGGIALLGSYVPATRGGEVMVPTRPHEITVYYRTFRAMWTDEPGFDWKAELEETIEHEYEHLLAELGGGDPVDEEERREIAEEAIRIHGRGTLLKSEVGGLGSDFVGFLRRTWILWVIIVAVAALMATR